MTELQLEQQNIPGPSPLRIFLIKTVIVTTAVIVSLFVAITLVENYLDDEAQLLQGGPLFWRNVEYKLYGLADSPDLPPEQKKRVIESLKKLSLKYRPYFDAISKPN